MQYPDALRHQVNWYQAPIGTHPALFLWLGERFEMTEKKIVIHEVDEIVIWVVNGVILLEQKTGNGNEQQCIAFPVQYARQVIKAIKAAGKQ